MVVVVALAMGGWWVAGLEPFSTDAATVVLGAGLVAMAIGRATRRPARRPSASLEAVAPWIALTGALVAWQLASYVQHPRSDHPTLSSLVNTALDPRPIRALAFAAWLTTAAWLARR